MSALESSALGSLAVLAHLVLVVPDGVARTRGQRALVALVYVLHGAVLVTWLQFGRTEEDECVCLEVLPVDDGRPLLLVVTAMLWVYALVLASALVRR
ncbi:hypothetical protein D0T12_21230 [Actinomadura spongiicola]|uniref:Uncharacterized protein n=1 Tax=Actinomadura spongiicola TaxID=2303421 RepID=A0A372GE00_9ACTN|nr:hypothetical protein [Actinomadura spongiicola]RFS83560.1 hypothetical protein D0T12_21230 [Actinomadura spongiicola]